MVCDRWLSEDDVRAMLRKKLKGRKNIDVAAEIGVSPSYLSGIANGPAPPAGKILRALGLRKVRSRMYEKVKKVKKVK
jgi:hypothetical protein